MVFQFVFLWHFSLFSQPKKKIKWPGFIQLNDSILISEKEISVHEYADVFLYLKTFFGNSVSFNEVLPSPYFISWTAYDPFRKQTFPIGVLYDVVIDSTGEKRGLSNRVTHTDSSVSFLSFISERPIVNISKEQALLYCELCTKAFDTLKMNVKGKRKRELPDRVYFRLPTKSEWIQASQDDSVIKPHKNYRKYSSRSVVISKTFYDSLKTGALLPVFVNEGHINKRGLINMQGNVAEMIMDSPYGMGGSFLDSSSKCHSLNQTNVMPPQQNIGFRVVIVVLD